MTENELANESQFFADVAKLLQEGRGKTYAAVNFVMEEIKRMLTASTKTAAERMTK
ncbi:MAG: hypothetical protein FWG50_03965 [Kiritimatiellaeota bacterium]|nr:hypothetical protein [Kiritimatiellota bacterium]